MPMPTVKHTYRLGVKRTKRYGRLVVFATAEREDVGGYYYQGRRPA